MMWHLPDGEIIPHNAPPCPACDAPFMSWWPDPICGGWWECVHCDEMRLPDP